MILMAFDSEFNINNIVFKNYCKFQPFRRDTALKTMGNLKQRSAQDLYSCDFTSASTFTRF